MNKPYFVMLYSQRGDCLIPLVNSDEFGIESLAMFETEEEAHKSGSANILGQSFGYEVHEAGLCVSFS